MSGKADQQGVKWRWLFLGAGGLLLAMAGIAALLVVSISRQRLPAELNVPPTTGEDRVTAPVPVHPQTTSGAAVRSLSKAELAAIHSHDDLYAARCRHDPALQSTFDLYRELRRRYESEKIADGFDTSTGDWSLRLGTPPPPACGAWLVAHAAFIDLALRYAESQPRLPNFSRAEHIDLDAGPTSFLHNGNGPIVWLMKVGYILAAEGERRLAAGDVAGAERAARAVARLSLDFLNDATLIGRLLGFAMVHQACGVLAQWAAPAPAKVPVNPATLALLDELAQAGLGREMITRMLEDDYLATRAAFVRAANGDPWRSPALGWDMWVEQARRHRVQWGDWDIKRYDILLAGSCKVLFTKRNAPAYLREYDQAWNDLLKLSRADWAVVYDQYQAIWEQKVMAMSRFNVLRQWFPNTPEAQVRGLVAENRLNLVRAMFLLRQPHPPVPTSGLLLPADSPWRDPFAGKQFQMPTTPADDRATTSTVIYSLGPDLIDQHAVLTYDPTNGTVSPGDVSVRVPENR